jgi:hypothetical protein
MARRQSASGIESAEGEDYVKAARRNGRDWAPPARLGRIDRPMLPVSEETAHSTNTGTFGAFRAPKVRGVSDTVAVSNRQMARSARRAMRQWSKTLPEGRISW